jgi:hypothetical protein
MPKTAGIRASAPLCVLPAISFSSAKLFVQDEVLVVSRIGEQGTPSAVLTPGSATTVESTSGE